MNKKRIPNVWVVNLDTNKIEMIRKGDE